MPRKADTPAEGGLLARAVLIALLAVGLLALACLYAAPPGYALVESVPVANVVDPDEEAFEGSDEEVDCAQFELEIEEEGLELEEPCEEDEESDDGSVVAPPECLLRTISARVFTQTGHGQVSLVIGYTASTPVTVTIDYRSKGAKGSLKLGHVTRRFFRQGVLRLTGKLSDSQMAKVKAASSFDVSLRVRSAPGYCGSYFVRHLTSKRKAHGQLVWAQPKAPGQRR